MDGVANGRTDATVFPIDTHMAMEPAALERIAETPPTRQLTAAMAFRGTAPATAAGLDTTTAAAAGKLAVVTIDGPLTQHGGWWWDGYQDITRRVGDALDDPNSRGVILRINSPGGVAAGAFEATKAIRAMKESAGKPIWAYADEAAYSAAYALATAADGIFLPPSGGVGSVGVITTLVDQSKALEKWGIKVHVVKSGKYKADGHGAVPIPDETIARFQARTDELAGLFASLVGTGRNMEPAAVLGLEAATFMGPAAVNAGLADGVMGWGEFVRMAATASTRNTKRAPAWGKGTGNMHTIARALQLRDDASEAEILSAIQIRAAESEKGGRERSALEERLLRETKAANVEAAFGTIAAWSAASTALESARAELDAMKAESVRRERDELVERGLREGRLTPALREWAAAQSVESLRAYLEKAPVHPALAGAVKEPAVSDGGTAWEGKSWESMRPAEKHALYVENRALYEAKRADHERKATKD
jgi:signal peptide peptidase SppA